MVRLPSAVRDPPALSAWFGERHTSMIIFGILLLAIGFFAHVPILWTVGIVVLVIGAALWLMGSMGHELGGRKHYY